MLERPSQALVRLFRHRLNFIAIYYCKHGLRASDGDHAATLLLPHAHVARQQESDTEFRFKRAVRQLGIAGAENDVAPKLAIELRLQRRFDVDLREDAESLLLEGLDGSCLRLVERNAGEVDRLAVVRI